MRSLSGHGPLATGAGTAVGRVALLVADGAVDATAAAGALEKRGLSLRRARGHDEGLAEILRGGCDVVLLALEDRAAVDVCRAVRGRTDVPIIVLSPVDDEGSRVAALEAGADDCVSAPFTAREVAARVEAVLRRGPPLGRRDLTVQDIEIRVAERAVVVAGRPVELTAREFDVLRYLAERAGEVSTRQRLLADVWGMEFPGGTRTVDVHIAQLRRKLGRPGAIRTVRGVGYKALPFPGQGEGAVTRREEAAAG